MLQLQPLDQEVPIFQQINAEVSPVILVNIFHVAEEDISTQLHQGIAGSTTFMSSAVASPHLFTRLTVPNLCVGP